MKIFDPEHPWHAHLYFTAESRETASAMQDQFTQAHREASICGLCFVGPLRDQPVGPHPLPQFEIHFYAFALETLRPHLTNCGLRVLIHPLTLDDLADHTSLAEWIGAPLVLDVTVLDPPGINQGLDRFGLSDF